MATDQLREVPITDLPLCDMCDTSYIDDPSRAYFCDDAEQGLIVCEKCLPTYTRQDHDA